MGGGGGGGGGVSFRDCGVFCLLRGCVVRCDIKKIGHIFNTPPPPAQNCGFSGGGGGGGGGGGVTVIWTVSCGFQNFKNEKGNSREHKQKYEFH